MRDREVAIPSSSERRGVREYVDDDGTTWRVCEVDAARVPGARGPQCLIFSSPNAIRRVWEYPPDWYRRSVHDLSELSWRR